MPSQTREQRDEGEIQERGHERPAGAEHYDRHGRDRRCAAEKEEHRDERTRPREAQVPLERTATSAPTMRPGFAIGIALLANGGEG